MTETIDTPQQPSTQPESFVTEQIERLEKEIAQRYRIIAFMREHEEAFNSARVRPVVWDTLIDFNHPTRQEIIRLIQAFPGVWEKTPNDVNGGSMDYVRTMEGQPTLRIWAGALPPCCKIVEEEIDVPAHKQKVRKVVCPEPLQEVAP